MTTLFSFKAGKAEYDETSHLVTPSLVKGEVVVKSSDEGDSIFTASWVPRDKTAGNLQDEDDELMIIPGDVVWSHVKSCTTGRVFCFTFDSGKKTFYWMQEKNDNEDEPGELSAKDKEISKKFVKMLEEEPEEEEEEEEESKEDAVMSEQ